MELSVIVAAYNEEGVIKECLASLDKQSHKDFEVIVVDDGSRDETLNKVSDFKAKNFTLKILRQNHRGPGSARNRGSKEAEGKVLVFVDADMTFDKDFLKKLTLPIVKGETIGTFSNKEFVSNWENTWARCWNINQNWPARKRHPKNYSDEDKVYRAVLRSEFEKVGGFTPGGYTDDYSLYKKLRIMSRHAPGAVFYHKNPESLAEIFIQASWTAKREYKLGILGNLYALIRASFPISFLVGNIKSVIHSEPSFVIFKLVYDFGLTVGIIEYFFFGKKIK